MRYALVGLQAAEQRDGLSSSVFDCLHYVSDVASCRHLIGSLCACSMLFDAKGVMLFANDAANASMFRGAKRKGRSMPPLPVPLIS